MDASSAISTTLRVLLVNRRFDRGSTSENEILHKMERAKRKEDAHAAARSFLRWLEELEVLE
jgi:hypothetical protein